MRRIAFFIDSARCLGAVALVAALLCSGCTRSGESGGASTDELRIAVPINPTQLNPILPQNSIENFVDGLLFDVLVTIDDRGNEVPDLAAVVPTLANGGISKDGLTITYHLRKNAKWHDGRNVTSKDVKYTWHAIMNPSNNVLTRHGYDQIASIDTPDAATVVMHMKRIFAPAIDTIFGESDTTFRILPEHLLARYANLNAVPFNGAPIGSGPYKFLRWMRGDRIELGANDAYFRGAPHIKRLTIKIITDDNTTAAQLRSHEADLAMEINGPTYSQLAGANDVTRQLAKSPDYVGAIFNVTRPPLDDLRVRRAIALATDVGRLIDTNTYGTATKAVADVTPFSWAFDRSLQPLPFDPAQAKRLLDAAGWHPGPDGIRVKNGQRLVIQFVFGQGSQLGRNVGVQVQQMLRAVGIETQLKGYEYAMLYAAAESGGILLGGKFDMSYYAWIFGADPDNSSSWMCSMIPPGGNNATRYCSAEMDVAQRRALSSFDRNVRKAAYAKIQALLLRDVPANFYYYQPLRYARTPRLQRFASNGISEGWNAQEWSLSP